jgi:oxygen-independent coproporphyrinogen-3 oxidase
MEANPGTFERRRFEGYRDAGITRLSIGVQSFDPRHLKALGRVHDADEARAAAAAAVELFGEVNLDLMYGLPDQTVDDALADVEQALAFRTTHLSCYELTLEPNTVFHRYPPALPDEDAIDAMGAAIEQRLARAGFGHYEVSAYARPGHACRHNLNYWRFGDYLGIGAGAHGKLTVDGKVVRTEKPRSPRAYLEAAGRAGSRRDVEAGELPFEFMLNALRLRTGFTLAEFEGATGQGAEVIRPALAALEARGLLNADGARLQPTELGFRFLNDLMAEFLPATPASRPALRTRGPVPAAG